MGTSRASTGYKLLPAITPPGLRSSRDSSPVRSRDSPVKESTIPAGVTKMYLIPHPRMCRSHPRWLLLVETSRQMVRPTIDSIAVTRQRHYLFQQHKIPDRLFLGGPRYRFPSIPPRLHRRRASLHSETRDR